MQISSAVSKIHTNVFDRLSRALKVTGKQSVTPGLAESDWPQYHRSGGGGGVISGESVSQCTDRYLRAGPGATAVPSFFNNVSVPSISGANSDD